MVLEEAWNADNADTVTEENLAQHISNAKMLSKKLQTIVAITGAIDLVTDGSSCYVIRNGNPQMGHVTGAGCQLSGILTAFLAANPENKLQAAAAAVCMMGYAGELAAGEKRTVGQRNLPCEPDGCSVVYGWRYIRERSTL